MKKQIIIVVALIIIGLSVWYFGGDKAPVVKTEDTTPTVSAPLSETTKVSDKLSEYKNEELGFSIKYPSVWDLGASPTGVSFVVPTGKADTNTLGRLESKVIVVPGKCAFPPVSTIKERKTVTSGNLSFNMISMSNSVQGNDYFDRMYSLQNGGVCYVFSLSSIAISPASKGYKGSAITQMTNNNKALIEAADKSFTEMIKSFVYIVGPQGQDEATVVPTKK